jgi:hypothetical protein
MDDLLMLARHGITPLSLALLSTLLTRSLWLVLSARLGSQALSMALCFALGLIAGIPNGLHWVLDIHHVNLQAAAQIPYSLMFVTDLLATLCGASSGWLTGAAVSKRWRQR